MKLIAKVFIKGQIETLTGLHIGGSKTTLDIGGIDNSVIKDSKGIPYIPGSSLKGKIRCLLERENGIEVKKEQDYKGKDIYVYYSKINNNNVKLMDKGIFDKGVIAKIFGVGADKNNGLGPVRFYARDAYLNQKTAESMQNKKEGFEELEMDYTESKWENIIDRFTSKADHPRQTERVPAGAEFDFEFVYNIFETNDIDDFKHILKGMRLLEDDYIGGSGSRGYGQIKFNYEISYKTIIQYEGDNKSIKLKYEDESKIIDELKKIIK